MATNRRNDRTVRVKKGEFCLVDVIGRLFDIAFPSDKPSQLIWKARSGLEEPLAQAECLGAEETSPVELFHVRQDREPVRHRTRA